MSLLTCKNVCLSYDGIKVLENINFTMQRDDYLCIVGANGAGKTTLMKAILGLKKPSSGTIEYGEGLNSKHIGYLPQQTQIQKDFPASVMEVVLSGCLNKLGLMPFYTKKHKDLALNNLELMGISHLSKKSYQELSGGQQQRVLLARALCASSKLLVLDEPSTGLDPQISAKLYSTINEIHKKGIAIITISHDIQNAIRYANKILHIGKEIYFENTSDYINSDIGKKFIGDVNYD